MQLEPGNLETTPDRCREKKILWDATIKWGGGERGRGRSQAVGCSISSLHTKPGKMWKSCIMEGNAAHDRQQKETGRGIRRGIWKPPSVDRARAGRGIRSLDEAKC